MARHLNDEAGWTPQAPGRLDVDVFPLGF